MKKLLLSLLCLFLSNLSYSQKFQIIENEYVMDSYLNNGIIFMKTKLINRKHKTREIDFNDPYANWSYINLVSSSIPVIYQEGRIKVDFKNVNESSHKLVLKFSDYKNYTSTTDTIDLPYIKSFKLSRTTFTVDQENRIDYDLILNTGSTHQAAYNMLEKKDICSCNEKEFKYKDGILIPVFDTKQEKLSTKLCLMNRISKEILFNDFVTLNFKDNPVFNFSGKNGTKGKNGVSAANISGSGTNGENGTDGENAPNVSVFISTLEVNNDSILKIEAFGTNGAYLIEYASLDAKITIYAKGGHGGDGGNGGDGAKGIIENETGSTVNSKGGNGGNGGNSGNAGNGGAIAIYHPDDIMLDYSRVNMVNNGGSRGQNGNAGSGASGYSSGIIFIRSDNGKSGSKGFIGSDGTANNFSKILALDKNEFTKLYQQKINKLFE